MRFISKIHLDFSDIVQCLIVTFPSICDGCFDGLQKTAMIDLCFSNSIDFTMKLLKNLNLLKNNHSSTESRISPSICYNF